VRPCCCFNTTLIYCRAIQYLHLYPIYTYSNVLFIRTVICFYTHKLCFNSYITFLSLFSPSTYTLNVILCLQYTHLIAPNYIHTDMYVKSFLLYSLQHTFIHILCATHTFLCITRCNIKHFLRLLLYNNYMLFIVCRIISTRKMQCNLYAKTQYLYTKSVCLYNKYTYKALTMRKHTYYCLYSSAVTCVL